MSKDDKFKTARLEILFGRIRWVIAHEYPVKGQLGLWPDGVPILSEEERWQLILDNHHYI